MSWTGFAQAAMGGLIGLLVLSGCAHTAPVIAGSLPHDGTPGIRPMTQLIIKWREPGFDPSRQEYLNQLERDTGVTLRYIRPMSGGAHVLRAEGVTDQNQVQRLVDRLGERPEVEYAEVDRLRHHMNRQ